MIEVSHLVKDYGRVRALDDVSFAVAPGRSVILWGHNGAGKTTTLKCLLGLIRFQGRVQVQGHDLLREPRAVRRLIGYVPQNLAYYDMTVAQTLAFFSDLKRVPAERGLAALAQVGLTNELDKQVGALSGGMRQRLALVLALLADPPVLLLDEPTASLDAGARKDLMALLAAHREEGRTIIFASHRPEEARELADTVLWMEGGRLVCECTPEELLRRLEAGSWLRLRLQNGSLDQAVRELERCGFNARPNHKSVLVQVEPGRKAAPLAALARIGLTVADFELEG